MVREDPHLLALSPRTRAVRAAQNNASRIMYINGDVDPWHGLSILNAPTAELPTLMVSGASHHAWTHPSAPTDQPTVVAARMAIRKQIGTWLGL